MTLLRALLQCHVVLRSHRNSLFKICLRHFQQQSKTEGEERSSKAFKTVRKTRRRITCLCKRFNLSEIRNHCYFYDFVYICIWLIKKISPLYPSRCSLSRSTDEQKRASYVYKINADRRNRRSRKKSCKRSFYDAINALFVFRFFDEIRSIKKSRELNEICIAFQSMNQTPELVLIVQH